MPTIQLPAPAALTITLEEALRRRRTNRDCTAEPLTDAELSALLWASAGITSEDGRRTTPSTLDLRAVTPYVLRADGAWRYDAATNTLEQTTAEDVRKVSTAYQFEYVEKAPVTIVFVADQERAKNARPTGVYVDSGTMGENCYLTATSLGLAGTIRASFDHDQLREAMKLAAHLEPIVLFTCGRPA
ncbi:nitroreductase family protein [Sutterella sp.]|uniref:nitroreductase family protein n=1 Tax=Sutterella sp. TaxID=1981025 RepID=UPI0026DFF62B|nr:nitroreductase family protein [Sutterella sp.]MDO5532317.1 nitroreductase family protein [Sutterella sp.]